MLDIIASFGLPLLIFELQEASLPADRNDIFATPTIHINYKLKLLNRLYLQPFFGYNQYGGKGGDEDKYSFRALELGLFAQYKYSILLFGIGAKISKNLNVKYYYSSSSNNRSDWFVKYSGDAGVRISYIIKAVSISMESWFGISNLADGPLAGATVYENHYRVMLGYTF